MALDTKASTRCPFVERFTQPAALVYIDDYDSYNALNRERVIVCHTTREWARDDDGDGWYETHANTDEGMWVGLRNFLHPFRSVYNAYRHGYVAIYEFRVNLKAIFPAFIAALVRHSVCT